MLQSIISFVMGHQLLLAALAVALLDFVFAVHPAWESNGILHWIYLRAKSLVSAPQA